MSRPVGDSTFAGAQQVTTANYTVRDSIGGKEGVNDVDLFTFHLDAGQTVTGATFNGGDANPDTLLTLFDSSGTVLGVNDDGGSEAFASLLTYTAQTSGTYYFGVSSYDNDAIGATATGPTYDLGGTSTGQYTLDITIA